MDQDRLLIVLIEDDPSDIELTLRALRRQNIENRIHVVRDGAEAVQYLFASRETEERPDLILLDLHLPKVDGLAILDRLKSSKATRGIPVVIMTSSDEEADLVRSYDLGANSYLTKSDDFDAFSIRIAELSHYWLVLNRTPG